MRNKLKRWSREALRGLENKDEMPIDINLVFRPSVGKDGENLLKGLKFETIERSIRKGLEIAIERTSKSS